MSDVPPGHLFLGERLDAGSRRRNGEEVHLEAADLTTHGVVVGMTGSGKTGLGVVLVEEALLQGIPTLVLDPKGDLANLLLTFPDLAPEDFAPWVEGADPATVAAQWREGLAGWGIGPERVRALRDAAEFTIYTPGSTSGVPLNVVGSLRRPPAGTDAETVTDEVEGFVSGLLALVGIEADPLASREHILLSNLIESAWAAGVDLDLAALVAQVQDPPLRKLGVFELDTFFPPADRTALALRLNGLLASRAFAAWAEGPDLDIDALLRSRDGTRPACAIVGLAHLSDEERQFVVSLVLGKLVTWMRRQPGTSALRVMVYFDEVAGFVPPNGMPPAKRPILTLVKQARAFGVGLVLATQNPVDVDYKGLSNAGTWMVGRLQTEQDKARLLSGLSAADGGVDLAAVSDAISSLGRREFVLRQPGGTGLFTTRWAMSYLRGPLTREQVARLMADAPARERGEGVAASGGNGAPGDPSAGTATPAAAGGAAAAPPGTAGGDDAVPVAPVVADGVAVRWMSPAAPWARAVGAEPTSSRYAAGLVARVALLYDDDALGLRHTEEWEAVAFPAGATVAPEDFRAVDHDDRDFRTEAPAGATYVVGDAPLATARWFTATEKALVDHLYRRRMMRALRNRTLKLASRPGESDEMFAARCLAAAEERADAAQAALTAKYEARLARAQDALEAAADRAAQAREAERTRRNDALVSGAGSLLGSLLGGRRRARSMAREIGAAARRQGRGREAAQRVETADNRVRDRRDALAGLEADLADELAALDAAAHEDAAAVEEVEVPLEKSDIRVTAFALAWIPTP